MKHMKRTLLTLLAFISIGYTQSATLTWSGPTSGGNSDFSNPIYWVVIGTSISPSSLDPTDEFIINAPSTARVALYGDITIKKLTLKGGCYFSFNKKTLTTTSFELESPSFVSKPPGSKIIYASANEGECYIKGYSSFELTDFYYPMNATRPKQLTLTNTTLKLGQNFTTKMLFFSTDNTTKAYLDLNGYTLTCNTYVVQNDNTGYIIPNINSSLIFHDYSLYGTYTETVRFANSSKTAITSGIQLKSIEKTGTGTATVDINGSVELSEKLTCASGTIAFDGSVTLLSDATQTAYVGESAGSITATANPKFHVQLYIPGRRVFRFLAHPFDASIALTQLTDDIDITGTGGTSNGFTATTNNNPSAFIFVPSLGDNTTNGLNPGWRAITDATSYSTWAKGRAMLVYIRGAKGQGLLGTAYTPSAVTLDMSGTINTGTQTISLYPDTKCNFVTTGNPYPSPIQMESIDASQRVKVGSTYWVFDSNLGANGGYISKLWDTDTYVLPAYAGFATELSGDGSIKFYEADKTTDTPDDIFLGGSNLSDLVLNVFVNDHLYDQTRLITHEQAQSDKDGIDGFKMENADINLFTLSKNGEQLSIDARPFDLNTERIAMGLFSSENRTIKIQADPSVFLNEHSVTLIDHYTNKQYNLNESVSVDLSIELNNPKTFGTERLELVIGQLQSHTEKLNQAKVHVYPNPSQSSNAINVQANSPIQHIAVMDVSGRLVWETSPENKSEFMEIPKTALANAGIYFIEITTALGTSSQKHVVQN